MDPIPTWMRRLWDIWDLRILVLLSFSLQVILCISGGRRKSISSLWINSVLVWSAYLMADWVATVALSKLSDAEGKNKSSNVLRAVWAPLLLLHLGGLDTITAYSLEDNQLWMRHLMGLVVQLSVAIYVILMSWKNSWFSFMSIPALVAGIIKYGEKTWALKSVWGEKYMRSIPFGGLSGTRHSTAGHDYVWALGAAHVHLNDFRTYLAREHHTWNVLSLGHNNWVNIHSNIFWDALEVQMGLMYDLIYTKAAIIYSKGGLIMRCISFGCTVSVLPGLIFQIVLLKTREEDEGNWHEIDIAITGVLIVGALALENYAAVVIFSSNWMMIWVIKQGREEWVKWLSQRFPWLFNKKKNWSQMMGQFDLLGYCLKCGDGEFDRSRSTRIIRSVLGYNYKYENKWNRYLHKTEYSVHPLVCNAILELCNRRIDPLISDSLIREVDEIWETLHYRYTGGTFSKGIRCVHLATEICYRLEMEWDGGSGEDNPSGSNSSLWKQNKKVSKALSDYMMYLLVMHPSLLPNNGPLDDGLWFDRSNIILEESDKSRASNLIGNGASDVNAACRYLLSFPYDDWSEMALRLKGKEKPKRWEIIKLIWLRTLRATTRGETGLGQKNSYFQQLRQGGELLL